MTENREVLTLLPKKRSGILRLVFSRIGLVACLLVVEIILLLGFYLWFADYFKWFATAQGIFSLIMVFYLINSTMDYSAKLTWMFMIMLVPVPATIFLWFTQHNIGHRVLRQRMEEMIAATKTSLAQDPETFARQELIDSGTDDLCRYLSRSGCFPVYEHTQVKFFGSGEEKYEAMLTELEKAEKFIWLEYFIIDEGLMWGSILKILADKAKAGVDVRVMYDGMCEISP